MGEELQVEGWESLKDSVDVVENKSVHLHVGYRNPVDRAFTLWGEASPLCVSKYNMVHKVVETQL